jgi:GT2 family glycosyltransferase
MTSIAVVILNYNGVSLLRQFLPSVVQHSGPAEVIVADNGSTDDSLELLAKEFPNVRVVTLDKNFGFCGGYNRALREIKADYYVLLNSDVEVTPGWILPLKALLDNDPSIASVQPKILAFRARELFEYAGAGGGLTHSVIHFVAADYSTTSRKTKGNMTTSDPCSGVPAHA